MHTLRQQHAEDDDMDRAIILSSVTDEQRTKVLGSHSRNALCNHESKKSLAIQFIELKGDILNDIAMVDPNSNYNVNRQHQLTHRLIIPGPSPPC
jgi:hypothetical protein